MKTIAVFLTVLLIITVPMSSLTCAQQTAQQTLGAWAGLQALPPGEELKVQLKNKEKITGRLLSSTDTTLSLTLKNNPRVINRDEVAKVYRLIPKSKAKPTVIGAASGAATGATIGGFISAAYDAEGGEAWLPAFFLGSIGAGLGALIGLAFGIGNKQVLIYEVRT